MPEHLLRGCRPEPLLDYLKALGLIRVIATQRDPGARASWYGDSLRLDTALKREDLDDFLLRNYSPSPLADPWNKDSGFPSSGGDKVSHRAVRAIAGAKAARLRRYAEMAAMCDDLKSRYEPDGKEDKKEFLSILRASVPDDAVEWLDSVFVLTDSDPKFPFLLGSGGNDGRLDFVNCFMRSVLDVMDPESGSPAAQSPFWLAAALDGSEMGGLGSQSVGQFDPGGAGGANASSSFEGGSLSNPWSFVLAMEGSLAFSSSASRRFESQATAQLSHPFAVRPTRAGYASSSPDEKLRGEIWMPVWTNPATWGEIRALFSEGRATLTGRNAGSGLDFARAVSSLGVDRGLDRFVRYMFAERFGKLNFAVPVGRFKVSWTPDTELLDEIAPWVDGLHRAEESSHALAAIHNTIEEAMIRFCQSPMRERLRRLFVLVGEACGLLGRNPELPIKRSVSPLPWLTMRWVDECSDGSPEFRLAAALASIMADGKRLRFLLDPVEPGKRHRLEYRPDKAEVPLSSRPVEMMNALLARITLTDEPRLHAAIDAWPGDISAFIEGVIDERKLQSLLQAMILVNWYEKGRGRPTTLGEPARTSPGAEYWLPKLCFTRENDLPGWAGIDPSVVRAAVAGNLRLASRLAAVRMKALGRRPITVEAAPPRSRASRISAALLFPVSDRVISREAEKLAPASMESPGSEGEDNVG